MVASPAPAPRRRWHSQFLAMLPAIITHAKIAFRQVRGQDRQDKIQETVANALVAFRRLVQLKKTDLAYPSVLARYAVAQIKDGRLVGGKMNCRDVSVPYCQRVKGVVMERLDRYDADERMLAGDPHSRQDLHARRTGRQPYRRAGVVHVAASPRTGAVAEFLAAGQTTTAAARKFKVSAGRISQLRRELPPTGSVSSATSPAPLPGCVALRIVMAALFVRAGRLPSLEFST